MANSLKEPFVMRAADQGARLDIIQFTTANTDAPTAQTPTGVTTARTGAGTFTCTYDVSPGTFVAGHAAVKGANPGIHAKVVSESSGVVTVHVHDEDNTSGVQAAADTTGVVVSVWLVFTQTPNTVRLSDIA